MDKILNGVRWKSSLIYLDEVIVLSSSNKQNLEDLDKIFGLLQEFGVILKFTK